MTLTNHLCALALVVKTCWLNRVTTKSDFARLNATEIAACASEGFLTNRIGLDRYSNLWLPTPVGLEFLEESDETLEF